MARNKLTPRRVIAKTTHRNLGASAALTKPRLSVTEYPVTEVFMSESGVRGEVLRLGVHPVHNTTPEKADAPTHTHVVLLPGNPGLVEYYRPLLRSIFHRLPQDVKDRATVHGLGLPGHDIRELNGTTEYAIQDHVQYCRSYLQSEEVSPPLEKSNIIFIGHSYGSYLGLRIIEEFGKSVTERSSLVMLMPALHQMGECAGAIARFLLGDRMSTTTWAAWAVTAFAPPVLQDVVVRALGHDTGVADVTRTMLDGRRRGLYLNICSLARDEVKNILEPSMLPLSKIIAGRSLLLYADYDRWCTPLGRERIVEAFGSELQTEWAGEGVRHAFVLCKVETEKVVRTVAPWISEKVRSLAQ